MQQRPDRNAGAQAASEEEVVRQAVELVRVEKHGGESEGAAREGMQRLLAANERSTVAPLLRELLAGMRERRARTELRIAMFYRYRRCNNKAAERRLNAIVTQYPEYSRLDDVLYELSLIQSELGGATEAKVTLTQIVEKFGWSPRGREAKALLDKMTDQQAPPCATTPK